MMSGWVLVNAKDGDGDAGEAASMGSVVVVNLTTYLLKSGNDIVEDMTKVSPDDECEAESFESLNMQRLQIGESDVVPALELALSRCKTGQNLVVRSSSKYAWGPEGRVAGRGSGDGQPATAVVPPYRNVEFRLQVVQVLDAQALDTLDLSPESVNDTHAVEVNAIYQHLALRRECGNRWYHHQSFQQAARSYSKGVDRAGTYLQGLSGGSAVQASEGREKELLDMYMSCLNNLCACYIS
jgi:hypothetical protein